MSGVIVRVMKPEQETTARLRSLVADFNRHAMSACAAYLSATASWSRGDGTKIGGRAALAARLHDFLVAFPDAYLTPLQLLALRPDTAVVEWRVEGTHQGSFRGFGAEELVPASRRTIRFVGASLVEFDDSGEIEKIESRIDSAGLLAQLVDPPAPARPPSEMQDFAERYTAAWCSQDPVMVGMLYAEDGSLIVNGGSPAVGGGAIAAVALGFMEAFPDMKVLMGDLLVQGDRAVYSWTLVGTNTGVGGTGKRVRISGFEVWRMGPDGRIAESRGYFDSAAYRHQIEHGIEEE